MKTNRIAFFASLIAVLMILSACSLDLRERTETQEAKKTTNTEKTQATAVSEPAPSSASTTAVSEPTATTTEPPAPTESEPSAEDALDYLDYVPIQDHAILFLTMEYDLDTGSGHATYDMDRDGAKDTILFEVNEITGSASVSVNGETENFYIDIFGAAFLIDIDRGNDYVDLMIFDRGPSEDPVYYIFRYDGTSLTRLGDIYGDLRCDRAGRIVSNQGISWYTYPAMVYSRAEVVNGSIIYHSVDRTHYIGDSFVFRREIGEDYGTWMEETTVVPAYDAYLYGPSATNIIVDAGTEFTILDVSEFSAGSSPNWYYVRLEDGRTGVFYYMKGD
ncbi:MAG: hypothetical protein JW780_08275 [Clostridiales bacterium]|nr:hypothetical protein [Clostridiales bacterium]